MPKQGLISQFQLNKYTNQIYRSVMPHGCYDESNNVYVQNPNLFEKQINTRRYLRQTL